MKRQCTRCKKLKVESTDNFYHRGKGYLGECKLCRAERDKRDYQRNIAKIKKQKAAYAISLAKKHHALKKDRPCADCGGVFHPCVMQFDHPPGVEKLGTVATFVTNKNWKAAEAEAAKCVLVCANCHAIRTFKRRMDGKA